MLVFEIAVVGFLVLLNGFFAMSELAVVSARRSRLQQMARSGSRGARRALRLADDPTGFLSTVQVGITLVGIFAGAYSGATLAGPLADVLRSVPGIGGSAETVAFTSVVVVITYLSLIIGELVPKRIALSNAERIAALVAPALSFLARIGAPVVWLLGRSTEGVLKLLRIRPKPGSTITEEEVKSMIAEGTAAGVFEPAERHMIEGVLRLADRAARSIMVPRPDVVWLNADDPPDRVLDNVLESGYSRFPVSRGTVDHIIGVVQAKDLLEQQRTSAPIDLVAALREPVYVDASMPVLTLLDRFKTASIHLAVLFDEHGTFEGVVTPTDILTAIAGDLPEGEGERDDEPDAYRREDGSWLLAGRMPVHEVERTLAIHGIGDGGAFTTLAGFVLQQLGHVPEAGEHFVWRGWKFEVVDLDRQRIDKVLAIPAGEAETA